jgi:hypothetical protein
MCRKWKCVAKINFSLQKHNAKLNVWLLRFSLKGTYVVYVNHSVKCSQKISISMGMEEE